MDALADDHWKTEVEKRQNIHPNCYTYVYDEYPFSYYDQGIRKIQVQPEIRPHSTQLILEWLKENYELADGVCIPRCVIYANYLQHAEATGMQTVNSASFGKIIRQQFPALTTRRLGTRGQSKYHYYGLAIKETSVYFDFNYSKAAAKSFTTKEECTKKTCTYNSPMPHVNSRNQKTCSMSEFPRLTDLKLPNMANRMKVDTLLVMYRAHCEHVVDVLSRPSFEETQKCLVHFWQGIPTHMHTMLHHDFVINILGICDVILYKTISKTLLPKFFSTQSENTIQIVLRIMKGLDSWIKTAMAGLPEKLSRLKLKLAMNFVLSLRRKLSINHFSQGLKSSFENAEARDQLIKDWAKLNVDGIIVDLFPKNSVKHHFAINNLQRWSREFEQILGYANPIDMFASWLENLVHSCIFENFDRRRLSVGIKAKRFIRIWKSFEMKIEAEGGFTSSPSVGSFQWLRLMCVEYVNHLVKEILQEEFMASMMRGIATNELPRLDDSTPFLSTNQLEEDININQCHENMVIDGVVQGNDRYSHQCYGDALNNFDSRNEQYEHAYDIFQPQQSGVQWNQPNPESLYVMNQNSLPEENIQDNSSKDVQQYQNANSSLANRLKCHTNRSHQYTISNGAHQSSEYEYSSYIYEETSTSVLFCPNNTPCY